MQFIRTMAMLSVILVSSHTKAETTEVEKKSTKSKKSEGSKGSGASEDNAKSEKEKVKKQEKPAKPKKPTVEKVAPPEPLDYGKEPKAQRLPSTEELLSGPEAGLVTTKSSILVGVQVIHNTGMNVQFPAVLSGAATAGFGLGPFAIYGDMQYFLNSNFTLAPLADISAYHKLRGSFLWSFGGGIEAGRAFAGRGIVGGAFTFPSVPVQLYGNILVLYYLGNAEIAGGLTYGISLGGRVLL